MLHNDYTYHFNLFVKILSNVSLQKDKNERLADEICRYFDIQKPDPKTIIIDLYNKLSPTDKEVVIEYLVFDKPTDKEEVIQPLPTYTVSNNDGPFSVKLPINECDYKINIEDVKKCVNKMVNDISAPDSSQPINVDELIDSVSKINVEDVTKCASKIINDYISEKPLDVNDIVNTFENTPLGQLFKNMEPLLKKI